MKSTRFLIVLSGLFFLSSANSLFADVTLPRILGSNMVLQRNQEIKVWGWSDAREKVTVHFADEIASTRAGKDGKWMLTLPAMKAGGPYTMKIRGRNIIDLENIMIGDVWICSGQSNMEWPVENSNDAKEEISNADYTGIRLFTVPHNVQVKPVEDIPAGRWYECSPNTIPDFSAVGYFFGREIHKEIKVPVGLISTNWGGTNIETWTSLEAIRTVPGFEEKTTRLEGMDLKEEAERRKAELKAVIDRYAADEPGIQDGIAVWADPDLDMSGWGSMELPGTWERKGLVGLDGIVWYRYEFMLTAGFESGDMVLYLGPIDDSDQTWVNGHKVGETIQQYNKDRVYTIKSEYLKEGRNVIAIRVEDSGGGGGLHGKKEDLNLLGDDFELSLAGEWKFRVSPAELTIDLGNIVGPNSYPTLLFNGMIHPLLNFPINGAIWYQGEANASRAHQYRTLLPLMIEDWRKHWEQPGFPFCIVQLANFRSPPEEPGESEWAELREAQSMALSLPNTGLAVTIDIGEADDIHPRNKQDVGKRLALWALKTTYGMDVVHSGPTFREMEVDGRHAILTFDNTGSGLICKDRYGYVKGFAVAGADREFHWARAFIKNNRVWVYSEAVDEPVAIRYGWANNPDDLNLYNMEGLPAVPFRTDDWPGITTGK